MNASSKLVCVIAAGGTAGHVRPALAVAEALRARGVTVTFAGTPDRVESRLVPEAGFELDTFPVSGFPGDERSPRFVRAPGTPCGAPSHCRAILRRRRPDVVLGGGGYVAGPMVLAARLRGIPAALTEADAHLGLANRLAAPFARRVLLAYEIPGRDGAKVRASSAGRSRARIGAATRGRGGARFGLPAEGPVVAVFGALAGARSLNELAVERLGRAGPPCSTSRASATTTSLRARGRRGRATSCSPRPTTSASARGGRRRRLAAGGTVWELAAAGMPAILVPYPMRPPITRRSTPSTSNAGEEPSSCRTRRSRACPRSSTSCSPTPRGSRRCATRCSRWRAPTPQRLADGLVELARRRMSRACRWRGTRLKPRPSASVRLGSGGRGLSLVPAAAVCGRTR